MYFYMLFCMFLYFWTFPNILRCHLLFFFTCHFAPAAAEYLLIDFGTSLLPVTRIYFLILALGTHSLTIFISKYGLSPRVEFFNVHLHVLLKYSFCI